MNNRIENLLLRVVSLEECFNSLPIDKTDQRRRFESIRYAAALLYSRCSYPSSKLDAVGEQLRLLSKNQGLPRLTDHVQDDDDLFRSLDDLQEAIFNYRVCSQPQPNALSTLMRIADGATEGILQPGVWTDSKSLHVRSGTRNDLSAGPRLEHLQVLTLPMTIA